MPGHADLEVAYRKALYQVEMGRERLCFKIDRQDPTKDTRLAELLGPFVSWVIITPCNPASVSLCEAENAARLENLKGWLETGRYRFLNSRNIDPAASWPDEPGFLILDIGLPDAKALGREYGQNAIVFKALGAAPRLIWLDSSASANRV